MLYLFAFRSASAARPDLVLYKVKYDNLKLTIVERGTLESAKNSEVYCRVKTVAKPPQIKTLIDDGTEVQANRSVEDAKTIYKWDESAGRYIDRKGPSSNGAIVIETVDKDGVKHYADVLIDLEDSAIQEQLNNQDSALKNADLAMFSADQAVQVQVTQNAKDIDNARTVLENSRLALMKYTGLNRDEIVKPETIAKLRTDMATLASNFNRDAEDLAQEDLKIFKSGDYLAIVKDCMGQIENAKSDLSLQQDREQWAYRMAKKGYQTASQAQAETSRRESYDLSLAKVKLNLANIVKSSKLKDLNTYLGDLANSERSLALAESTADANDKKTKKEAAIKKSLYDGELRKYKEIVEEIKKCKIPAPQDGMVVYYIPEQARGGSGSQQSIVAQGEPVREGQRLMQIPDLKHMIVNTKVHEAMVSRVHKGQKATIRVDSVGGGRILRGDVESVANMAAQTDWMSSDVKVYLTRVVINAADIEGLDLKPGMSAEVTIAIADALEHVLTVPIQAIVGGSEMGAKRSVVVMTPEGAKERSVVIGLSNEKFAEIKEGLQEGDEVVENPKQVLGDKAKTREAGAEKSSGKGGGEGKGGKGKGGGPSSKN